MAASKTPCPVLLMDGGLGTTLADSFNCTFDNSTPLWSSHLLISNPSTLLRAQSSFADAGADILLTATYQASAAGFALTKRTHLRSDADTGVADDGEGYTPDEAAEYMRRAVRVARDAFNLAGKNTAEGHGKIALSLGAYGATMHPESQEYTGKYDAAHCSVADLAHWHRARLDVFAAPDTVRKIAYVAFETLPLLAEVVAVREAMRGRDTPFWIACVFPADGTALPDGSSVADIVRAAFEGDAPVPVAVGMNCTKILKLRPLIAEFEAALADVCADADWPSLVCYPDGAQGLVYNTASHQWEVVEGTETVSWDATLWEIVSEVRDRGRWKSVLLGGCCKTTAEDIRALRKRIDDDVRA